MAGLFLKCLWRRHARKLLENSCLKDKLARQKSVWPTDGVQINAAAKSERACAKSRGRVGARWGEEDGKTNYAFVCVDNFDDLSGRNGCC
jgi:hypothetical protein